MFEVHDGVRSRRGSADPGKFLLNYALLGAEQAVEEWKYLVSVTQEAVEEGIEEDVLGRTAHDRWVPFAQNSAGDVLFVDHRPGDCYGNVGELSFGATSYRNLWANPTEMLLNVNRAAPSGGTIESMSYVPAVLDEKILEWVVPD
ncbi:hypothetical protein ACIREE_40830 [Streptomyces sp. NPDC102467]|uniref:hypothetical protein n=1 Tax=Streptomyces sp. NPDC102467 TaxID=3366179 RepID=UPI0037F66AE9